MTAASDALAARLRPVLARTKLALVEKKMFGGSGFMLGGNMLIGTTARGDLLVRVDPDRMDETLTKPGAYVMQMGSRTMTGFIAVGADALPDDRTIRGWIDYAQRYVETLPAK
jgi:TfoX/Sxy family transcriptional regulator of competence genes